MANLLKNSIFKGDIVLTDFLDPGQCKILKTIGGNDCSFLEFGGYPAAEKKRVLLNGSSTTPVQEFGISVLEINYPQKFYTLTHSAILGTLASSGVELGTFGDIITNSSGRWQFFVKTELSGFFLKEITRIGRMQVKLKEVPLSLVISPKDTAIVMAIVVSSMRLDTITCEVVKQSRKKVKKIIDQNLIQLNWHGIKNSNIIVKRDDVLSIRHFGRAKVTDIKRTKKNKYKVVLKIWQAKK